MINTKRHEFYRELVRLGATSIDDIKQKYPLGIGASTEQMEGWLSRFNKPPEKPIHRERPRLLNSFKIGADPEFIFKYGATRMDARQLGLKTGLALGADQNTRLVELRPKAYRNALKVTASILQELRWLAALVPTSVGLDWVAGAFLQGDGIGGHVHFGRKRETRDQEVDALANIMAGLVQIGVYPIQQVVKRMRGDDTGQVYGRLNDIRLQSHGYEYRAFPSWLGSPWTTYLTLVLAKLAVYDPSIVAAWIDNVKTSVRWERAIRNVLRLYSGRDDDAELALWALEKQGFPRYTKKNFRPAWGIEGGIPPQPGITVIPPSIGASPEAVSELFHHFVTGEPLKPNSPQLNWSPSSVPDMFTMVNTQDIHRLKGYGELVWDLCLHRSMPITFVNTDNECAFIVTTGLASKLTFDWKQKVHKLLPMASIKTHANNESRIYIGVDLRSPRIAPVVHKVLLSGVFPIWSVKTVTPYSFVQWQEQVKQAPSFESDKRHFVGQVLYQST